MPIWLNVVLIFVGLAGLMLGGDWLVTGASRLAQKLGLPTLVIGLTVVAFGTSAPELLVSVGAALRGASDIAVGNVIGSNIANVGLILGVAGLIYPLAVEQRLVRLEIPILIGVSILVYFMSTDGTLSLVDGLILVAGIILFNVMLFVTARSARKRGDFGYDTDDEDPSSINALLEVGRLVVGIAALVAGAQALIEGATNIALAFGVSEFVVGLTLVAFGTSLPELAASIVAAVKQESDIAVGNIIGSNISNLLLILGATAVVRPISVELGVIQLEFLVMVGFSLLLIPFALNRKLGRSEGAFFLVAYMGFVFSTLFIASG